jgi:ribosomal protein S18 acetylase RimI-like enzyme
VPEIVRCVADLEGRGVERAVTPALNPYEAEPFFQAGFELHEELHLLARSIDTRPPEPTHRLRGGRPWHRRRVLDIDARAFDQFWQFDKFSLKEARRATPTNRFVVAVEAEGIAGYAVTGRAGGRGYLQRLAVDPSFQGRGIGTSLVHDSLHWLHRKRVGMALVNTQERNQRALMLYERLGFIRQREGLLVLAWSGRPA